MFLWRPWVYGITIWPLVLTSLVTAWEPVVPWLLAPSLTSLDDLVSLFSTLSIAHLGYLQLVSAFLRCSISFWRSSGLLQTVLALWVGVLITLYLAKRWWQLSHCKYWVGVCRFPIQSNKQLIISLWFYNGIQDGDGTILLVVFHCKLHGKVNTNPHTGAITRGWGQYLELFALSIPYIGDQVAKWIVHGSLNMHIMGLNLSATSWLTM